MGSATNNANKVKRQNIPLLWPALLVIVGVVLLFDNFLLIGDFNIVALLPLLLVVAGAQVLLRGDLIPSAEARTFGITRGSVEAAALEISSGEIDVDVRALNREGRLIAGQFAANSRPQLQVQDTYTHLKMERARTPWFSFADWQIGLASDLPWQLLISTHLGQVNLDLSHLIIQRSVVASGFGDIYIISPKETFEPLHVQSALGNIHISTPLGYRVKITVEPGWFFKIRHDEYRYENPEANIFLSNHADEDAPLVEIYITGTFGDAYLA